MRLLDDLAQDARSAARNLRRYPIVAVVAILSLAAGIGATTATLTIHDTVFRNPPPLYADPGQLSTVFTVSARGFRRFVPAALYEIWTQQPQFKQPWAAARDAHREEVRAADRTATIAVQDATPSLFGVLGVPPAIGQTLDTFSGDPSTAVVLSDRVWRALYDARPDVVGQTLWISDRAYTVIGVMPARFWFGNLDASVWIALDAGTLSRDAALIVLTRRPEGVAPDALRLALAAGMNAYAETLPEAERSIRAGVDSLNGTPMGHQMALIVPYLLGACVLLTWLIACANVAILLMAQWTTREHEIGVRAALGASRGRLIGYLLAESGVIAGVGGALGIAATYLIRTVIVRRAGPEEIISLLDTAVRPSTLLEAVLLTLVTAALIGIAPALHETGRASRQPLRSKDAERVRQRWRHALVVIEITATVALLVVTGALVDGYRRQTSTDLGYSTRGLMVLRVENAAGVKVPELMALLNDSAPGAFTAAGTIAPFGGRPELHPVMLTSNAGTSVAAEPGRVTPSYFSTLGVSFRAGRGFADADTGPASTVAVVNESLAQRLSPGQTLVGRSVRLDDRDYDVVGIVADSLLNPLSIKTPAIYTPLGSGADPETRLQFLLRAPGVTRETLDALRRDIPREAPGHTITGAFAVDDIIAIAGQETLAAAAPLLPLLTIGMVLTATGIYAVLAFTVTRRSKEFAVRLAIGASNTALVRLVAAQSARLAAIGAGFGVALTFGLTRVVRAAGGAGSMFDTPSWPAFVVPAVLIFSVAMAATWIPSRRALKADPATLLRTD